MDDEIVKQNEILFVDDSATVLAMAKKMLGEFYTVQTAKNGIEAREVLRTNQDISMIFTDMQMPEMNGMQLLLKIRDSKDMRIAKMPVIMVTGKSDTEAARKAVFDIGATDFLGKPFDKLGLCSRARAHIGKGYRRRGVDKEQGGKLDMLATPSSFHSIGCQSLEYAFDKKIEFSVVYIELVNYHELKALGEGLVKQIIVAIAARIGRLIREEDVATRIGENKYAILMHADNDVANIVVEKLYNNLKNIDFSFDDINLTAELAYGFSIADIRNKKLTFAELCNQANQSLDGLQVASKNTLPIFKYLSDKFGKRQQAKKASRKSNGLDLWAALKYVVDGEYAMIPVEHKEDLIKSMKAYLKHVKHL